MKIAIPKERRPFEGRVAATPDTVKRFVQLGAEVSVEASAGENAAILDHSYADAGATIHATRSETFAGADVILKVQRPRKKRNFVETERPNAERGAADAEPTSGDENE